LTSGIPLSGPEQEYIRTHIQDGPGAIAHALGRKRNAVKSFIRRERAGTSMVVEIPPELSRAAREKGISPDQVRFVALRAILQRVKTVG
jgi:hypothetical protein